MQAITDLQRAKAFELFGQDASTNQVATSLFNKNFAKAKKLRDEYDAQDGKGVANGIAPTDEPDEWDLSVKLPATRMDQILLRFSAQEKADAIAAVLTARLSAEV